LSYRKEKKYSLTGSDFVNIKKIMLDKGMQTLYPSRIVNSCYFDSSELTFFHHSEEGVLPRKKVRIRWYDNIHFFKKETKISSIEGRFKYTEDVSDINSIHKLLNSNIIDNSYGKLLPKIIISYEREYFILNKLRITFDKNILYTNLKLSAHPNTRDTNCVMEVKTPFECDDDYIEFLVPYPTSRFSKYTRGLINTYNIV